MECFNFQDRQHRLCTEIYVIKYPDNVDVFDTWDETDNKELLSKQLSVKDQNGDIKFLVNYKSARGNGIAVSQERELLNC